MDLPTELESLYVLLEPDENGKIGIIFSDINGLVMPLVTSSREALKKMYEHLRTTRGDDGMQNVQVFQYVVAQELDPVFD